MSIKNLLFAFLLLLISKFSEAQLPKLNFKSNETVSYEQMLEAYQKLDSLSEFMELKKAGLSDAGKLIQLLVVNKKKQFSPTPLSTKSNVVWLILNGIHPGESEGIDASLAYLNALAKNPKLIPDSVTILIIPSYNVDGMRNRKEFTRCGQNGPIEKGFRASAGNLDLNRDFLKADSKNTFAFYSIFQQWQPDVFLDTHTSNGADYQYTMTLISTQKQKLGGPSAELQHQHMTPFLYQDMKKKGLEMAPYVNIFGQSPDKEGYEVFIESPKFSTGYTSLFGTLGFVAETHMLKPYADRVIATYHLFGSFQTYLQNNRSLVVQTKTEQQQWIEHKKNYQTNYTVDKNSHKELLFKGYELELQASELGSYERHYYNRKKPFEKTIPYYDSCKASLELTVPRFFVVPSSLSRVQYRLKANGVVCFPLEKDTILWVQAKYIKQIKYAGRPYEGHFVHSGIETDTKIKKIAFNQGDWLVPSAQAQLNYLMEVLSPETWDGFMSWNFFDGFLSEKEGFSDYVFEEEALQFLKKDPELQSKFEEWKRQNPDKLKSKYEVLGFIYKNSPYYEQEYLRFPIFTISE